MKIAYLDCYAGASGDMLLGALLDAGLPKKELENCLDYLNIEGINIQANPVLKANLGAINVTVGTQETTKERNFSQVLDIVQNSQLPENIRKKASRVFEKIGRTEASIHRTELENVHLHELGGLDTIVDVCGVIWGLEYLSVERIVSSPLPLGRGSGSSEHGVIPIPPPATLELLKQVPVYGKDIPAELVTPTGAALISTLADSFGPIPLMQVESVGYGAGDRELQIPNVLRIIIGEEQRNDGTFTESLCLLETNIDDLNPEVYEYLIDLLLENGALDVFLTPMIMKKNRPGTLLSALCEWGFEEDISKIIFKETSTIGLRKTTVERISLPRSILKVQLPYGEVRVKKISLPGGSFRFSPEYEDCLHLARSSGTPLLEIMQEAIFTAKNKET
ncbi:MAG: nickel pincer cofactor biosynthesis protein LarC [Anaerolineales bacterium]